MSGATGPLAPGSPLGDAEALESELRAQLADLARVRARAEEEAGRLQGRADRGDADPSLGEIAARYRSQAQRLGAEVDETRALLREHEALVERLRADAAGA